MTLSNSEKEEAWVDAWNNLSEIIEKNPKGYILVPENKEVTFEEAKGWMQDAAYESNEITFSVEYYKGKKSVFINKVPK